MIFWILSAYKTTIRFMWKYRPPVLFYSECKFFPSCSEYGTTALKKYGLMMGTIKTACRILRCNPFSKGGVDNA